MDRAKCYDKDWLGFLMSICRWHCQQSASGAFIGTFCAALQRGQVIALNPGGAWGAFVGRNTAIARPKQPSRPPQSAPSAKPRFLLFVIAPPIPALATHNSKISVKSTVAPPSVEQFQVCIKADLGLAGVPYRQIVEDIGLVLAVLSGQALVCGSRK